MATKLIDRTEELERLRQAIGEPPQLVVVRGRRRVGKSFLLAHALERQRRGIYLQADEQPEAAHLELLAREVSRLLPGAPPLSFDSWDAALNAIGRLTGEGPIAIVLDEFQWLAKAQPALDSIIQRHWDAWQRDGLPITLILSGSALRLMEQLLDSGRPLYGRADYRPLLLPLDYRWASEFDPGLSAEAGLRRFAVLGGTPQYQVWAGTGALKTVLRRRVIAKGESLYEEPLHLLREEREIRDPGTYFAIVKAIAEGRTRFAEIATVVAVEPPNLKTMLNRLERLGYIESRAPLGRRGPVGGRTSYRLLDPFFRFWFRFVFHNRSLLERGHVQPVMETIDRDLDAFVGHVFEDCCRTWVGRYAPEGLLPRSEQLGSWWSRDGQTEIDIAGTTRGQYDLLGSCKWHRRTPTRALGELLAHRDELRASHAKLVIFARGFEPKLVKRAKEEDVLLISAQQLFG